MSNAAPATIAIFAAIDRLAGGRGLCAADAVAEIAVEYQRLQALIDACLAERETDPRFVDFPARLPYGSVHQLIEILEGAVAPRPLAAEELLGAARAIQMRRDANDARRASGLQAIIEKARAGELGLWGDTSRAAHAETHKLPHQFLLRNITLDHSHQHLGLAQSRMNPLLQRAIIAPDGPRSSAYFNVRIIRADFERLFNANLRAAKPRADEADAEQAIRTWYGEQHVPLHEARGEIPNREQSEADAKSVFGDIVDMRNIMRRCREMIAPAAWRARGRRGQKK